MGLAPADLSWLHPPHPLTCLSLQPGSSSLFYKGTKHVLLPATLSARTMSTCLRDPSRPPTKGALADRPHFSPSLSPCHFHHHLTLLRLSMSHLRPPCCQSVNPLSFRQEVNSTRRDVQMVPSIPTAVEGGLFKCYLRESSCWTVPWYPIEIATNWCNGEATCGGCHYKLQHPALAVLHQEKSRVGRRRGVERPLLERK